MRPKAVVGLACVASICVIAAMPEGGPSSTEVISWKAPGRVGYGTAVVDPTNRHRLPRRLIDRVLKRVRPRTVKRPEFVSRAKIQKFLNKRNRMFRSKMRVHNSRPGLAFAKTKGRHILTPDELDYELKQAEKYAVQTLSG